MSYAINHQSSFSQLFAGDPVSARNAANERAIDQPLWQTVAAQLYHLLYRFLNYAVAW